MRKIDSQIIYALKAKRGDSLFTKVPALRNAALTDDKGRVKVVIHTLSPLSYLPGLLDKIKAIAGVEIVNAPTNLNRIIALIPLDFADLANNIRALANAGAKIIVDDVYWTSAPAFQDGVIAQAVNEVTSKGVLYFSSAGNSGNYNDGTSGVWEGNFSETGAAFGRGTAHNFGGSIASGTAQGAIANTLTAPSGYITLQWSDTFYNSTNDYDLYVLDSTGSQVVGASTNVQAGNAFPFEYIGPQAAGNQVVVVRASGQARYLRLDTERGRLSYNTVGQIWGHPAATGAIAVAATSAAGRNSAFTGGAANPVETFSSDGPRRVFFNADGSAITPGNFLSGGGTLRQKPDITAADGVATSFPAYPTSYFNPFYGTSAAAPHAAAIADGSEILQAKSQRSADSEHPNLNRAGHRSWRL
jgi:hypothetical protein